MKYHAVTENHLYSKAYSHGRKQVTNSVVVYVMKDYIAGKLQNARPDKRKINRIGLTVSKKIGGAVERNRTKRIIREGFRQLDKKHPLKKGFIIIIVARVAAVTEKSTGIYGDLKYAMKKLDMYQSARDAEGVPETR